MLLLKPLLLHLARPEVTEVSIASARTPAVRIGAASEPIGADLPSTDDILHALFNAGGSRHVDTLGPRPTQWTTRIDGVGPVLVSAMMQGDTVHARFTLRERESQLPVEPPLAAKHPPPPAPAPAPPPAPPPAQTAVRGPPPSPSLPVAPPPHPAAPPPPAPRAAPAPVPVPKAAPTAASFRATPAPDPAAPLVGSIRVTPPTPADRAKVAHAATMPALSATPFPPAPRIRDRLLTELLAAARAAGASDLHLVAGRPPLFRVAGKLSAIGDPLDPKRCEDMLLPCVPARLAPLLARDGSVDFSLEEPGQGRFRVNVGRQRTGLKASIRLIAGEIPTLAALGLPDAIALATRHHQGLIVLTGPTGHGKTTTLAAVVDILNREGARHIITVEDPVEYLHPRKMAMMSQREVGTHTRSFAAALKASLREDPDVIVVGELRDTETVRMALSASETGHLVLGTMNTPSAAKTIDRLIDLFPPGDQQQVRITLAGGLRLVVGQRLLPNADETALVAAAEVLPGSIPLWNLIRDSKTYQIPSLQQRGKGLGILRLDDSLADLVRAGRTTLPFALAVAEQPDELEALLTGRRVSLPHEAGLPPHELPADRPSSPLDPSLQPQISPAGGVPKGLFGRAGALFGKRGA